MKKTIIKTKVPELSVLVELKPELVEMAKKAMKKPKASATQIAKYVTGLLEEEVALQERIQKNKKSK